MGKGKPKGNVHVPKTTQHQMVLAKKLTAKQVKNVSDFRPDDSDDELKIRNDTRGDSDDDDEEEVFDLDGEGEDSDEDDDEDGGDSDAEDDDSDVGQSDDSDNDMTDDGNDQALKNLVDGLDPRLRQKVMMGRRKGGEAADDDSDEESDVEKEGWGKKKAYWSGDTADLEIGQDVQDAEDEEEAAEELQREKFGRMQESDYFEDFGEGGSDNEDSFQTEKPTNGKKNKGKAAVRDKLMGELEYLALGDEKKESSTQVEHIIKDLSKLTEDQKLAYVKVQSPELLGLIEDLKVRVEELRHKVGPLRAFVLKAVESKSGDVDDDIVDYLEVKQQLLLSYCINVTYYLYMKAQGLSVKGHPVMKQLLELRYAMEKMRALDGKLKHQIDRLMKLSVRSESDPSGSSSLRPNPLALLAKDGKDDDSEEESDMKASSSEFYRAPKMAAAPYKETESQASKREDRLNRKKKKLNSSEIMETLREEFSTAPETSSSSGISKVSVDQRRLADEANERKDFEEERFVRLTMSRNEKKDIRRRTADASRLDNFNDIGDIGEFEELAELSKGINKGKKGSSAESLSEEVEPKKKSKASVDSGDAAKALQRAVSAFTGAAKSKSAQASDDYLGDMYDSKNPAGKKSKPSAAAMDDDDSADDAGDMNDDYDAEEEEFDHGKKGGKRRRAPSGRMDEDGDDDAEEGEGLLEEFSRKKRDFAAKKKEHYAPEARYGGLVESVPESGKRAATYEIMKNKGLTPHRKKENRNPRVKKRQAYEKAIVRRKGQVREVTAGAAGSYDGELTGIKANIARSRKIGN